MGELDTVRLPRPSTRPTFQLTGDAQVVEHDRDLHSTGWETAQVADEGVVIAVRRSS